MKRITKLLLALTLFPGASPALAQNAEMADKMRSEGKIYVVVAVILVVLGGLILYLFTVDRKLKKLEKQLNDKHQTN